MKRARRWLTQSSRVSSVALQLADFKWQTLADGEAPAMISGDNLELAVQRGYANPVTDRGIAIAGRSTSAILSVQSYTHAQSAELMTLIIRYTSSPVGTPPKL